MPGDETKNYDLVIEFAEQAYRDLLGTLFDSDAVGSICWILEELRARVPGFPDIPCGTAFIPDVFFDRPTDIALPAGTRDTIDIRVHLGEGGLLEVQDVRPGIREPQDRPPRQQEAFGA